MSVARSLIVLIIAAIVTPLVIFNTQGQGGAAAQRDRLSNLQVYEVLPGSVELSVSAVGTIEADEVIQLSFLVPGRVDEVLIDANEYVLAGDVLVELEKEAESLVYEQGLLTLEDAELALEDLLTVDDDDVRLAQAEVDAARGAYQSIANAVTNEDIAAAEVAYQQALEVAQQLAIQRDQAPGGYDSVAYNTLDAQAGEASFNAEIARLRLESLRTETGPDLGAAGARVALAQRELERVLAGPTEFEIERAEILIRQAEADLEQAETNLQRRTITAPFDGVVSRLDVEAGSVVVPGQVVMELTDVEPLQLTVEVDEIDIGLVAEGLGARVELDALPDVEFGARLMRIAPVGQNDGGIVSYDVDVVLDSLDLRVRAGMTAEATIIVESRDDVLTLPNQYIRVDRTTGQAFVDVVRADGLVEETEVEIGLRGTDNSEVAGGLQQGDLVAVPLDGSSLFGGG